MKKIVLLILVLHILFNINLFAQDQSSVWQPELTETWEPVPAVIYPSINNQPPSDAIILFNGINTDEWENATKWNVENGELTIVPRTGGINTIRSFGDIQLHIEWRTPENVDGDDQRRGNSGIIIQGLYEVQILDSYNNSTYTNGQAGAIYKQYPPLVNASLPPGEWQTYDIFFDAPVFRDDGNLAKPAFITVLHNGVLIHNRAELKGPTIYRGLPVYEKHSYQLPLSIQGSRHEISFRNIWVREF